MLLLMCHLRFCSTSAASWLWYIRVSGIAALLDRKALISGNAAGAGAYMSFVHILCKASETQRWWGILKFIGVSAALVGFF
jgi:hypothetical protein